MASLILHPQVSNKPASRPHARQNSRSILGLHANLLVHDILNPLSIQSLNTLPHSIELGNSAIRDNHDLFAAEILKVHAHLLCAARAEADVGRGHLEGILLLARDVRGGGELAARLRGGGLEVVVVRRVAVAGAIGRVGVLHGAQEAEGAGGLCRSDAEGGHCVLLWCC